MKNHIYPFSKFLFVLLELILLLRLIFRLFGYRSIDNDGFKFFYHYTEYAIKPFQSISFSLDWGARSIEFKTIAAIIVYSLLGILLLKFIKVIFPKEHSIKEWND